MADQRHPPGLGSTGGAPAGPRPPRDMAVPQPISTRRVRLPEAVSDAEGSRGLPAGQVLLGGLLGLALAILLNAEQLLRDAEEKPFGRDRDISVAVWEPVERIASTLRFTQPRRWADDALGRDVPDEIFDLRTAAGIDDDPAVSPDGVQRIEVSEGLLTADEDGEQVTEPGAAPVTTVTTEPPLPPGVPTPEDPLELWIVGDSMVQFFGDTLASLANDTGVIDATAESKLSSGLSRPDFFDWPARLAELLADEDPEAFVIMYGGNDAQGLVTPDGVAQPFSDLWVREYSLRVGAVMDLVTEGSDRQVIWVGQPIMRSDDFDSKMQQLNRIYEAEAATRSQVTFVDTRALFQNANGAYERFLPDESGELVDVRLTDGVHLSTAGGRWLSELLLETLGGVVDLEAGRSSS